MWVKSKETEKMEKITDTRIFLSTFKSFCAQAHGGELGPGLRIVLWGTKENWEGINNEIKQKLVFRDNRRISMYNPWSTADVLNCYC